MRKIGFDKIIKCYWYKKYIILMKSISHLQNYFKEARDIENFIDTNED